MYCEDDIIITVTLKNETYAVNYSHYMRLEDEHKALKKELKDILERYNGIS